MAGAASALKNGSSLIGKSFSSIPGPKLYPLIGNLPQVLK